MNNLTFKRANEILYLWEKELNDIYDLKIFIAESSTTNFGGSVYVRTPPEKGFLLTIFSYAFSRAKEMPFLVIYDFDIASERAFYREELFIKFLRETTEELIKGQSCD